MKIAIIHQDLEDSERLFHKTFYDKGIESNLFDIRTTSIEEIINYNPNVVLNRVYASVANRDYTDVLLTLQRLEQLEKENMFCINSCLTSRYDYSKFDAANKMLSENIRTPETILINSITDLDYISTHAFIDKHEFPLIVKRNTGGRGKDIIKVNDESQLIGTVLDLFSESKKNKYFGGYVIQEFLKSCKSHDCRIGIIEGEFAFAYARTLISSDDSDIWLASVSKGSKMFAYTPSEDEINLAKNATKAIGAMFNEVDLIFTEEGPGIIENNPTPNYDADEIDKIKIASNLIINAGRKNEKNRNH